MVLTIRACLIAVAAFLVVGLTVGELSSRVQRSEEVGFARRGDARPAHATYGLAR